MRRAKDLFTKACVAMLNNYPMAAVQVQQALEELALARAELRSLDP